MKMKCGEFNEKLEKIKSDVEYAKRLIEDFKRTGKEEEENIQWIIQNIENSASWFRERLSTSSEAEAREILGEDLFVGTEIAEKIFGGTKPFEPRIPFSRAELMEAKMEGKILLYRPGYSMRGPPITPESLITSIQFNDPRVNLEFFRDGHVFDFDRMLKLILRRSLRTNIEKSSWNLLQFHEEAAFDDVHKKGSLPSVSEAFFDLLSCKKLTAMVRGQKEQRIWVGSNAGTIRLVADAQGSQALVPAQLSGDSSCPFYTCESREVE